MDLLVVGAGAMGRWLARTLDPESLAFVDIDPDTAADAAAAVGGRVPDDGERFAVVALAVPMHAVGAAADAHADRATDAVVDVTGAMRPAVDALRAAAPERERLSLHPLFAPDRGPGRIAAVPDAPGPVTREIRSRLADAGNDLFETTPGEHDRAMETVQAAAHTAILAYGLAAEDVPPAFHTPVSETLAGLVDRVTGGDPAVYADVQATFDGAERVADAARRVADADDDAFAEYFAAAGAGGDGSDGRPLIGGDDRDTAARPEEPADRE